MNKIIFEREVVDFEEPTQITFELPDGMTIGGFKTICKRLASAIGFAEASIEDEFGNETLTPEEMMAQAHIKEIIQRADWCNSKFTEFDKTGSI